MLDISLGQAIAAVFGCLLVGLGIAGLMPVLLRWRRSASLPSLRIGSMAPALASVDAYIRPSVPRIETAPVASPPSPLAHDEVATEAEELKAQLFAIRMTLSDVSAEVQTVHELINDQGFEDPLSSLREAS
jgi:hypothetical protein